MATDYGTTLWCTPSTGLVTTRTASGISALINRLACMLSMPRGKLYYHRHRGLDLADYLGTEIDAVTELRLSEALKSEVGEDPAVDPQSVVVTIEKLETGTGTQYDFHVAGDSKLGPFAYVQSISAVTLQTIGVREVAT